MKQIKTILLVAIILMLIVPNASGAGFDKCSGALTGNSVYARSSMHYSIAPDSPQMMSSGLLSGLNVLVLGTNPYAMYESQRITGLGADVTYIVQPPKIKSLTLNDLENYDVIYIASNWGVVRRSLEEISSHLKSYVNNGGGLVVGQYNSRNTPYTPDFVPYEYTISDTYFPTQCGKIIVSPTHYISSGLNSDDMPDVYDRVPLSSLSTQYNIIAKHVSEEILSVATACYGEGRIVLENSLWTGRGTVCNDDSDIIIERIFYWASRGQCNGNTEIPGQVPVPEFPSMIIPAISIIGLTGFVIFIRKKGNY
ncbi:PEF-CTERM sorting domain-containing protein [Methanoplanus sp. FWC-SCC4]|uniref:PEF-CTERM sorting domain-containing protein n=1 Tax=Methanochimaera problematica TaxID=2609417 RepID=A0AA97FCW8_9EURY|nr:PEF-CTERM sorting domain-containing protein [Methanoplanus sp. FWC-SCC4]WOF16217.1 PEF-CTERM sorting domain-containing protein [Methanoplanus sp. FWC-SCC4]